MYQDGPRRESSCTDTSGSEYSDQVSVINVFSLSDTFLLEIVNSFSLIWSLVNTKKTYTLFSEIQQKDSK